MLHFETSSSATDTECPGLAAESLEDDEETLIPEDKCAHRIQPFPEPCLGFCHWILYPWGAVDSLGCLYALGLGGWGQMRGRENAWVDTAVGLGSLASSLLEKG